MTAKWIRPTKRLGIMFRDNLCCAYCGASVEDGASLTLDHIIARDNGGTNHETNLITCCTTCNSKKGTKSLADFLLEVGDFGNALSVQQWVMDCTGKKLTPFKTMAKEVLETRRLVSFTGNFAAAKNGAKNGKGK